MPQVAIKKVLQDKRFKNREYQIMKMVDHPNIVRLKQCFYSHTEKDETFLHLVLEYVPDTVYRYALFNLYVTLLNCGLWIVVHIQEAIMACVPSRNPVCMHRHPLHFCSPATCFCTALCTG